MSNDREVESVDPTTGCATRNWKYSPPFFRRCASIYNLFTYFVGLKDKKR